MTKRFQALIAACMALLFWPLGAHAQTLVQQQQADDALKVVLLGDSLTSGFQLPENEGFSAQLEYYARSLRYNMKVVSLSRISQTSAQGLYRMDEVLAQKPDMVLLQLGYDDALQSITMRELASNLNQILNNLKYHGIDVILIHTTPPPSLRAKEIREYESLYTQLAQEYNIRYFSLAITGSRKLTLDDLTHPNARGTALIVSEIFPLMEPLLQYRLKVRAYKHSLE